MKYRHELKFKRKFPFLYIVKRLETTIERIHREYTEIINLLPIVVIIYCFVKIKNKIR
jgi:hypothetical protein